MKKVLLFFMIIPFLNFGQIDDVNEIGTENYKKEKKEKKYRHGWIGGVDISLNNSLNPDNIFYKNPYFNQSAYLHVGKFYEWRIKPIQIGFEIVAHVDDYAAHIESEDFQNQDGDGYTLTTETMFVQLLQINLKLSYLISDYFSIDFTPYFMPFNIAYGDREEYDEWFGVMPFSDDFTLTSFSDYGGYIGFSYSPKSLQFFEFTLRAPVFSRNAADVLGFDVNMGVDELNRNTAFILTLKYYKRK